MTDPSSQTVAQGVTDPEIRKQQSIVKIRRSLEILHEPGAVFEIRCLGCPKFKTVSGYFDDFDKAAELCYRLDCGKKPAGIYTTLNPVNPALLSRAVNRLEFWPKSTTSDSDIIRRRWLFIDIDPVRPSGIAADDGERETAITLAGEIEDVLRGKRWPFPLIVDSGNGYYLLYRIDLPADDEASKLTKRFYAGLTSLLGNCDPQKPHSKLDVSVANAARIARVGGDHKPKGRPHRREATQDCLLS